MKTVILFLSLFWSILLNAQDEKEIYRMYEAQYSNLLRTRGLEENEITDLFDAYKSNRIQSDDSFASLLGKLYPRDSGIGVLFYFFKNDTLRRAYYVPGKVMEIKYYPISKNALLELHEQINTSLDLQQLSKNRIPINRGVNIIEESITEVDADSVITRATRLLIPSALLPDTRHLLIIPAFNIGTFPFHILKPFSKNEFLIEKMSFTIVPSLIDLVALRIKLLKRSMGNWDGRSLPQRFDNCEEFEDYAPKSFQWKHPLFVSNPQYPQDSIFYYPNLPGAEREIDSAIAICGAPYWLLKNQSAKKDSVLKYLLRCDLAYFATHGVSDAIDPMGKSFLVLSGTDPYLKAREIMNLRGYEKSLPNMVILSACQTGLGKSLEAGTAGLARSFLIGGSSHVIMSLWSVDDEATAFLMSRFMYYLQIPSTFSPSEPLRQAILDTRKKFPKPSQWASFSLFGIDY